jgi:hypothetical protein
VRFLCGYFEIPLQLGYDAEHPHRRVITRSGIIGHQHVPGSDHWDPGRPNTSPYRRSWTWRRRCEVPDRPKIYQGFIVDSSPIHRCVISWRHDDAAGVIRRAPTAAVGPLRVRKNSGGELTGTTIEKFRWMVRDGREGRSLALRFVR